MESLVYAPPGCSTIKRKSKSARVSLYVRCSFAGHVFDLAQQTVVTPEGVVVQLGLRETQLLSMLVSRAGWMIDRATLDRVLLNYHSDSHYVTIVVSKLRHKLPLLKKYLQTRHGQGYCLVLPS